MQANLYTALKFDETHNLIFHIGLCWGFFSCSAKTKAGFRFSLAIPYVVYSYSIVRYNMCYKQLSFQFISSSFIHGHSAFFTLHRFENVVILGVIVGVHFTHSFLRCVIKAAQGCSYQVIL